LKVYKGVKLILEFISAAASVAALYELKKKYDDKRKATKFAYEVMTKKP